MKDYCTDICLTVTGKTIAENLATVPDLNDGQDVIHKIQH
jgi:dihydroxy-acid dehydratase